MNEFLNKKVIPPIMKFVNSKIIMALRNGILYTMPLTIIGSIFLILSNFPYQPVVDWLTKMELLVPLQQASGATFDIIAIAATVGIAYEWVKAEKLPALNAGIISFVCFLILQESFKAGESGEIVTGVIDKGWTGGKGMIAAILIGLIVGYVYSWFIKRDIRIKMPAGVPEGVVNSFTALIPALVLITGSVVVYALFKIIGDTTFLDTIYNIIQTPLQGITDSLGGVIVMGFMVPFLWFFGVHGSTIIGGIMQPILMSNMTENQAILDAGKALTLENGGHIVTQQFFDQYMTVTGAGMTIGIVIFMIFFAKSARNKELGKLGGVPGLFNINEPILFGTPIVLNPFMAVPFILMPILSGVILYTAQYLGIVPLFGGVMVPWTTPPIISGFLVNGWQAALLQALVLALSFFVYLPFMRKIDKINLEDERKAAEVEAK